MGGSGEAEAGPRRAGNHGPFRDCAARL